MANGKPLCRDGVQTRFESAARGYVELPCPICRPDDFAAWAEAWTAPLKPELPPASQISMFATSQEYPE
jgi:hypothetical protein